jgi:hypothetical protein
MLMTRLNLVIDDVARAVPYADEFSALVELLYVILTRRKVHEIFVQLQQKRLSSIQESWEG